MISLIAYLQESGLMAAIEVTSQNDPKARPHGPSILYRVSIPSKWESTAYGR